MITIIAALAKNRVIGKNNKTPWHLPEDLRNFKKQTTGNTVIMGRKTWESIGGPLPNRNNIVLSTSLHPQKGIEVYKTVREAIENAKKHGKEIFVIGGSTIYQEIIPLADKMILSHLRRVYNGDAYFPEFNLQEWDIIKRQDFSEFELITYLRKTEHAVGKSQNSRRKRTAA